MKNQVIMGIENDYIPISNAFTIDMLETELNFELDLLHINNININNSTLFVESFESRGKYYCNLLINVNIRVDYISSNKNVKYKIFEKHKLCCICTDVFDTNKNTSINTGILDAGICIIEKNNIYIYILFACSVEV